MKHQDNPAQTTPAHDESNEDATRPLRLDRKALRLEPPIVRFAEGQADTATR
jgi:hypothetical protein